MKANIKKNVDNKIVLSIGMIVKNEEKHLENCLSALKKFMDQISCELIIVDTGSTDKTKEIALKYTDKVYDFEWIDDFSAARNYGLEKAVGKWFMFLDADEYIDEDCNEMVSFFNMPELYERYNSASYIIRNYDNMVTNDCSDFLGSRLVKLTDGVKFHGSVHEWLPQLQPHGYFSTVFHHYGYLQGSKEFKEKRVKRNLPLIEAAYKDNPTDVRVINQMADSYSDCVKKQKFILEALEICRKNPDNPYRNGTYVKAIRNFGRLKKYDEALKLSDEYFESEHSAESVVVVNVYLLKAIIYANMEKYENCVNELLNYFNAYNDYKSGKLNVYDLKCESIDGITPNDYKQRLLMMSEYLFKLNRYDEAVEYLQKVEYQKLKLPEFKHYLSNLRSLINETNDFSLMAKYYKEILTFQDDEKTSLMLYLMEQYYMEHPDDRMDFVDAMINSGVEGPYIDLMKLVKDDKDDKDISDRLLEFVNSISRWNDGYSEAVYLAMKHDLDLTLAINNMSHNILKDNITLISKAHIDYAEIALQYCKLEKFSDSIKKMLWMVSALEAAVYGSSELMSDDRQLLFDTFISVLSDYVMNIYNPELFNPEDAEVLPELHRFGYYMTLAFNAKNDNNDIAYIRCLKEALRFCEPMKDVVSFYLNEFEEELRNRS